MNKAKMIQEILIAYKAGGGYADGDIFLALAFRSESELIAICTELNIKVK